MWWLVTHRDGFTRIEYGKLYLEVYHLVGKYQHFGACCTITYSSTLKMEIVGPCAALVPTYLATHAR